MNNNGRPTCDVCGGDFSEQDPVVELRLGEFAVEQRLFSVSHAVGGEVYRALVHLSCVDAPQGPDRGRTLRGILDAVGVQDASLAFAEPPGALGEPEPVPDASEND
ncbi:hypothetical protein [Haloprofundus halobius]|uniref:hypothetical protein n=1 Tax=Haloprofundus halobius TaxID=2876194 RepID=UPI001CCE245E|nr:hypothetical protein [Haloprofundus halobius]